MTGEPYIHPTCEAAFDGEGYAPYCERCGDRLGEMYFYSMRR